MNGVSLHWFQRLWEGGGIVDISGAFKRSLALGLVVMVLTVLLSLMAGLAFRKRFRGSTLLFYVAIASLIVPSIVTSLGIALEFRVLDDLLKNYAPAWIADNLTTTMGMFTSGLGAHLTWTLPFGLLVMFAIFNRFDAPLRGGRARSGRDAVADVAPRRAADHRCRRWSASACSASRCPGTRSRARARPWASTTRCRWSCRR